MQTHLSLSKLLFLKISLIYYTLKTYLMLTSHNKTIQRGFTLIELLVVISIIGLLSSIVLAALSSARLKAQDARVMSDMVNLRTATSLFYSANNSYYDYNLSQTAFSDTTYGGKNILSDIKSITLSSAPVQAITQASWVFVEIMPSNISSYGDFGGTQLYVCADSSGTVQRSYYSSDPNWSNFKHGTGANLTFFGAGTSDCPYRCAKDQNDIDGCSNF